MSAIRSLLSSTLLSSALLAPMMTAVVPTQALAQEAPADFATVCPEMTDSIYRLYTAALPISSDSTTGFRSTPIRRPTSKRLQTSSLCPESS